MKQEDWFLTIFIQCHFGYEALPHADGFLLIFAQMFKMKNRTKLTSWNEI